MSWLDWSIAAQALLYTVTGIAHFRLEKYFLKVMPPWVPRPLWINRLAGAGELGVALGLCFPVTRQAALGLILLLLVLVSPVHFHMLTNKKASLGWPRWALWLRLPMQLLLILWAYSCLD